ncbi:MAG: hypothetical protein WHT08_12455 [Bryobacteraceae bacterium]
MREPDLPHALVVTSIHAGDGKTHVACGLARWLLNRGFHPVPLHLGAGGAHQEACPGGISVSRPAALLAEACRLAPEPLFESGWSQLEEVAQRGDVVVVEAQAVPGEWRRLPQILVERGGGRLRVNGFPLPAFSPALTHAAAPELEGLPAWEAAARPRIGVVSLPHLLDFRDLALLRGAEWLASTGVGQFDFVFVPATSDAARDAAWLEETGLAEWLREQALGGAVVVSCGWEAAGARRMEREDVTDYRRLSILLQRKLAPPMPGDAVFDELAAWVAPWAEQDRLLEFYW